jgi:hypothetical protein
LFFCRTARMPEMRNNGVHYGFWADPSKQHTEALIQQPWPQRYICWARGAER